MWNCPKAKVVTISGLQIFQKNVTCRRIKILYYSSACYASKTTSNIHLSQTVSKEESSENAAFLQTDSMQTAKTERLENADVTATEYIAGSAVESGFEKMCFRYLHINGKDSKTRRDNALFLKTEEIIAFSKENGHVDGAS